MFKKTIIGGLATVFVAATAAEITFPPRPVLLYNPSESAAIGWYKLGSRNDIKRDDMVAAFAPKWARKLADERE